MTLLFSRSRVTAAIFWLALVLGAIPPLTFAQRPDSGGMQMPSPGGTVSVTIAVRDVQGTPPSTPANVHFYSLTTGYDTSSITGGTSDAVFSVPPGEYRVEVRCDGYQLATDEVSVAPGELATETYFTVLLRPAALNASSKSPAGGPIMTPQLQQTIAKGVEALRQHNCDAAKKQFQKGVQMAPSNPQLALLMGTAEFCLQQMDLARKSFERAVSLDPNFGRALLSLGEMQLAARETSTAIVTLEKAVSVNAADWRVHLVLASAYLRVGGSLSDAESHAIRAAELAGDKGSPARLLLGQIYFAEGRTSEARKTWQRLLDDLPSDPAATAAKHRLEDTAVMARKSPENSDLPLPKVLPDGDLPTLESDTSWSPPDIDNNPPSIVATSCATTEVLDHAFLRTRTQLANFEKFTATEHIEHQEIDRHGAPIKVKTREFSYIVFVVPYHGDSFYLEESRDADQKTTDSFPTPLATTGLNSLAISLLQPADRNNFRYECEGLTKLRGETVWEIRFQEDDTETLSVRRWKKNGMVYNVPFKGRIWISQSTYDVLRVETDLLAPIIKLQLTRDHLRVDYGPVKFDRGNQTLWLPWDAEMFMELRGKRYHHRHYLSDYQLFEVDTSNKISKPKDTPTKD
jgi:cytochrome c-type biogenesis protein CcmH/NrfG